MKGKELKGKKMKNGAIMEKVEHIIGVGMMSLTMAITFIAKGYLVKN